VKGSGNGRCAHRRINHTRAESRPGRDPADAERFSGSKISAIKFAPLCKCKKCNEFTLSKKRRFVLVNYRKQRNTRNATELTFLEISPKPTTTSALPVPGPTRPFPCNRARFNTQWGPSRSSVAGAKSNTGTVPASSSVAGLAPAECVYANAHMC
jgi:hypothetical protein